MVLTGVGPIECLSFIDDRGDQWPGNPQTVFLPPITAFFSGQTVFLLISQGSPQLKCGINRLPYIKFLFDYA